MRGDDRQQAATSPEQRVPQDHPLRSIRAMVGTILAELSPRVRQTPLSGGPAVDSPEKLLRALLVQVLFGMRSEPPLMEELNYNLIFRWFVGLNMDEANPTVDCADKGMTAATSSRPQAAPGHAARRPAHIESFECDRLSNHMPRGLRDQPTETQAHREGLRAELTRFRGR